MLRSLSKNGTSFRIGNPAELREMLENTLRDGARGGLFIDRIEGRISLDGKKLTSKEIKSQSATIELLERVLSEPGNECRMEELPHSSYARSKNEMASKIVAPFNQALRDAGYGASLECRGKENDF